MTREVATSNAGNPNAGRHDRGRRFSAPLRATILLVFVLTTLPVLIATIQINQHSSRQVVRAHAKEMIERFRQEMVREIVTEFDKLRSVIATAAELGGQAPDFFGDKRALRYLFSLFEHSETMLSVYVGREDGSFRQARRIHDQNVEIHGQVPPPGSKFAYRVLEPSPGAAMLDRYTFLDPDQNALGDVAAESGYDPRQRPWYKLAAKAEATTITDPELFWALGLVGFTVAEHYTADGVLAGVVAADVTLDSFSSYLAKEPVSPNSVSYLLDDHGLVLASSDGTALYGSKNTRFSLSHVADIENRLASIAYGNRPKGSAGGVYEFRDDQTDYIVGLSSLERDLDKPWRLMVLTPVSDFTQEFTRNNQRMLAIGAAAIVIQLLIVYTIASLVASPLQRLAGKVARIQSLDGNAGLPMPRSRVREIDMLAQAVDTLDTAMQAFARFVPVELVRDLLKSDRKLELGGQSRFLTVLFCDVEAFSTLAERIATRDLLARVSALLSTVNKRVHEERGTIDKFIGDGVMAFWGAPSALEDHAWHGCVAALAIQRDLERMNTEWRRSDTPSMRLRIGIHSDVVLVGNVGSKERMSYTVMGDGVNIASRLEGCNKIYGTLVCISHDTFREAGDRICVRPIDEVQVKGRRASITIYELLGVYHAGETLEPDAETLEIARITQAAFDALINGDPNTALAHYRMVLDMRPDDPVATLHVSRLDAKASLADAEVNCQRTRVSKLDAARSAGQFSPSCYSAAMVHSILQRGEWTRGADVLDVGCGSGVLLAAAGCAGARHLCGVDIEPNAVAATRRLLRLQCHSANLEVHHGEMFEPVEGRRFDLVVTNLPQFPMDEAEVDGRLVSWSAGGADGRMLIDRFIGSLAAHLAPGGRALATHNDFIGLDRTCAAAAHLGLTVEIVQKFMVPLPNSKLAVMSEEVLKREIGHSIRRFGNHTFGMVSILSLEHSKAGERHT